jgi:hypothetical protein
LAKLGLTGEVVVVDNGSADRSAAIAESLAARVVREPVRGYGSAVRRGIREARGRYIIMADADLTYDFTQIDGFVKRLDEGADVVMGNRMAGHIAPGAMPWLHRWIGTPFLTATLNLLHKAGISDVNCGLRGMRKSAMEMLDLECPGMEFASEMLVKASQHGLAIAEIPVDYHVSPVKRTPNLRTFIDGWRHLRLLLLCSPRHILLIPGLLVSLSGLAFFIGLVLMRLESTDLARGLSTAILANGCLLVGTQAILFGACAMIFGNSPRSDRGLCRFLRESFTLEKGLVASAAVLGVGVVLEIASIVLLLSSPGRSAPVQAFLAKLMMFATSLILVSLQFLFSSMYVSLLGRRSAHI